MGARSAEIGAGSAGARTIRRARPEEAALLSDLAMRSKGHWGYGPRFLAVCRPELTVSAETIAAGDVYVLEEGRRPIGFYSLARWKQDIELSHFFVDPPRIGSGAGRALWEHAVQRASALGFERMLIQSDPHAEGFYLRLGAHRIGEVPSSAEEGRVLPLLLFSLVGWRS